MFSLNTMCQENAIKGHLQYREQRNSLSGGQLTPECLKTPFALHGSSQLVS